MKNLLLLIVPTMYEVRRKVMFSLVSVHLSVGSTSEEGPVRKEGYGILPIPSPTGGRRRGVMVGASRNMNRRLSYF